MLTGLPDTVAGVENTDHGAASGVVNVFHQLGGSLGLGVLVFVFARTHAAGPSPAAGLSHHSGAANTAAAALGMLGLLVAAASLPRD